MNLSPSIIGFIKALGVVVIASVASYLADAAHLTGVLNPVIATVVAALAASFESYLKANSGNTTALFGTVSVK